MIFEVDYTKIDWASLPDKETHSEVKSVLDNPKSSLVWLDGFPSNEHYHLVCGYSSKKRILLIILYISTDEEPKRVVAEVKVADEEEIRKYFLK